MLLITGLVFSTGLQLSFKVYCRYVKSNYIHTRFVTGLDTIIGLLQALIWLNRLVTAQNFIRGEALAFTISISTKNVLCFIILYKHFYE